MPDGGVERRLERIEDAQNEMRDTLAEVRATANDLRNDVADLAAEVGRVPAASVRGSRLSVTDRLHNIEAVVTPVGMEAAVHRALDKRRAHGWTLGQKVLLFLFAVLGAVEGFLRLLGVGG